MKKIILNTLILFIFTTFVSCASNVDKAQDHMEKGNWKKAHEFWVLALKDNPEDEQAIEGKRLAEKQIINLKLIRFRNLLSAGKSKQAVDLAWELEKLYRKWGYSEVHATSSFHAKQIKRLYPQFIKLLKTSTYQKSPVKSYILITRFEPIFSKLNQKYIQMAKKEMMAKGDLLCLRLRRKQNQKEGFYKDISERICHIFNKEEKLAASVNENLFIKSLYKQALYKINIKGFEKSLEGMLKEKIDQALMETPYLQKQSEKKLFMSLSGQIDLSFHRRTEARRHAYEEQEDYKVEEEVKEDGEILKKVVKKTREVTRYFNYNVQVTKRVFQINVKATFELFGKSEVLNLVDKVESEIVNHNRRVPHIGLYPKSERFQAVDEVMKEIAKKFAKMTQKRFETIWEQRFCDGGLPLSIVKATEEMMKCRMLNKKNNKYLSWLKKYFYLTSKDDVSDFEALIGLD